MCKQCDRHIDVESCWEESGSEFRWRKYSCVIFLSILLMKFLIIFIFHYKIFRLAWEGAGLVSVNWFNWKVKKILAWFVSDDFFFLNRRQESLLGLLLWKRRCPLNCTRQHRQQPELWWDRYWLRILLWYCRLPSWEMYQQGYFPIHRCEGANIFNNSHLSSAN